MRRPRGPVAGRLVETTTKTIQSRFLLRPCPMVNAIIKGLLGRAQKRYGVKLVIAVAMSNHIHALVIPESSRELAGFMRYVNSNLARKIGKLHGWNGPFWARRYQAIPVSEEEAAQVQRLEYFLRHGAKEGLVSRPSDWPGVHFVDELCRGYDSVQGGIWHDKSGEYNARRRREKVTTQQFVERQEIRLAKLPCWSHLSQSEYAQHVRDLVRKIEVDTRANRELTGVAPMGVEAVLKQDPHRRPRETKTSPAPLVHASSHQRRLELIEAFRQYVAQFRAAAEDLKQGILDAAFPEGSFPPGLPWVPETRPSPTLA